MSDDLTLLHNPRCSTSRFAADTVAAAEVPVEVVEYLKHPLTAQQLHDLISVLEDEPGDLVRRDATFSQLGLTEDDVSDTDKIVALLVEHPRLMQRPVLIRSGRAIIGRPKSRVQPFLQA